jgi:hypothetical protein
MAINITKRRDFIHYIFEFFGKEEKENLVTTYDIALTTKYPVDWEAFYEEVIKSFDKRVLPMPKYFSDKVVQFKKIVQQEARLNNESIIRVELKNGYCYDFTVNNYVDCRSLSEIRKRFEYKDENKKTKNEIKKITRYPKETTLIGKNVIFNVNLPRKSNMTDEEKENYIAEKEQELKNQVKILFMANA